MMLDLGLQNVYLDYVKAAENQDGVVKAVGGMQANVHASGDWSGGSTAKRNALLTDNSSYELNQKHLLTENSGR